MTNIALPTVVGTSGLSSYLEAIKKFPMLQEKEEYMYARRFRDYGDVDAAHALVTSHLRLAAKIAFSFRHYGLPVADLISESNIGLMQAVKKFDPEKGFRLSTYAMWWIKAALNQYVLNSWSLVKMGTVAAQKKLFFNLSKLKSRLGIYHNNDLSVEEANKIASELNVKSKDVIEMNRRIGGDSSLNTPVSNDYGLEKQDIIADDRPNQEIALADSQEKKMRHEMLANALKTLNERERYIILQRHLKSESSTLEELGHYFGVSRERVRQLETRALRKLTAEMQVPV